MMIDDTEECQLSGPIDILMPYIWPIIASRAKRKQDSQLFCATSSSG